MMTRHWFAVGPLAAAFTFALSAAPCGAQTLYGLSHATGASALRAIAPGTGASALVAPLGLDAVVTSTFSIAPGSNVVYVAGRAAGSDVLVAVSLAGPSVTTRPLDRGFANLHVRADGQLVGLSPNAGAWELRRVDPATGTSTLIAAIPGLVSLVPAASTLEPGATIHQVGRSAAAPGVPALFVIDAMTGAASSVALGRDFHSLHVRGDHALLGLGWNGSAEALYTIDATTGASAAIQTFPSFGVLPPSASAIDRGAGRVHQVAHAASPGDPPRLYTRDASSGGPYSASVGLAEGYAALLHTSAGLVAVGDEPVSHATSLALARPNPFHASTVIPFTLSRVTRVRLEVVDVAGRVVQTLVDGAMEPGAHSAVWRGSGTGGRRLPPGVYHARLHTEDGVRSTRLVLLH